MNKAYSRYVTRKWLDSRRLFLKRIKEQARLLSGDHDHELQYYEDNLSKLYSKKWDIHDKKKFNETVLNSRIVLCGDFHSSPGAQKFHARFIKDFISENREKKIVVGLECFGVEHQDYLNAWVSESISDEIFLEKVDWDSHWGFNFQSYKNLILNLKSDHVRFLCVNSYAEKLKERDEKIASFISSHLKDNEIMFVVIGQSHLAPEHLPQKLAHKGFKEDEVCFVHLNSEVLYFTLADLGLENKIPLLKRDNHFCFLNTPPWIQWQDHLFYLEEQYEEDQFLSGDDFNQVVFDYISLLQKDLNISSDHEMFGVVFVDELMDEEFERAWGEVMRPMVDSETSFYWPERNEGVLVVPSFNHAATVAGRYVHMNLMGVQSLIWEKNLKIWTWLEAVGYFMSKLINPKRRPRSIKNMSAFLQSRMTEKDAKIFINKLIQNRVGELGGLQKNDFKDWAEIINAARLKGSLLGESLFNHYIKGDMGLETLKNYFTVPINKTEKFDSFYNFLVTRLESQITGERHE